MLADVHAAVRNLYNGAIGDDLNIAGDRASRLVTGSSTQESPGQRFFPLPVIPSHSA
jgi:hypothetical protein